MSLLFMEIIIRLFYYCFLFAAIKQKNSVICGNKQKTKSLAKLDMANDNTIFFKSLPTTNSM